MIEFWRAGGSSNSTGPGFHPEAHTAAVYSREIIAALRATERESARR